MLEPANLRSLAVTNPRQNLEAVIRSAGREVIVWPSKVPVGVYQTLVGSGVDPLRFLDPDYMRKNMSQISEPIEREKILIAPNAGPYSMQGHVLVFYSGEGPCEAFLSLSEEARLDIVRACYRSSRALLKTQTTRNQEPQVIWLMNRGDRENSDIKNQSIPRFHVHVLLRDDSGWCVKPLQSLESNKNYARVQDAVGVSELTLALNKELCGRLRLIPVLRDVEMCFFRYVELSLPRIRLDEGVVGQGSVETPAPGSLAQIIKLVSEECEDIMVFLKGNQVSYGYSIAVLFNSNGSLQIRAGFYRDYAETLFGPVIFREPAAEGERGELETLIKSKFNQFRQAWENQEWENYE